jgi:hypothetical protein
MYAYVDECFWGKNCSTDFQWFAFTVFHMLTLQAVNDGTVYKGHRLNMSWQLADGKSVPASPTVPDVRPILSPVAVDSNVAKANSSIAEHDIHELTSSPLGIYEVCSASHLVC